MSDLALLREVLRQMEEAIRRIERRFVGIQSAANFTQSHHYGNVDAEVVFNICTQYLREIKTATLMMQQTLDTEKD